MGRLALSYTSITAIPGLTNGPIDMSAGGVFDTSMSFKSVEFLQPWSTSFFMNALTPLGRISLDVGLGAGIIIQEEKSGYENGHYHKPTGDGKTSYRISEDSIVRNVSPLDQGHYGINQGNSLTVREILNSSLREIVSSDDYLNIIGSDYDDILIGGDNGNTIGGNAGKDRIFGGGGNDEIDGGEDTDTIVFDSKPKDSWRAFKKAKKELENRDNDLEGRVVVPVVGTERDTVINSEIGDFNGEEHSLSKLTIEILRNPNGTASGTVIEDGEVLSDLTNALQDGNGGGMWYDTLTPIAAGTYTGYYRVGGNGKCIELEDWDAGKRGTLIQFVDGIDVPRTVVQLHPGNRNGSSEGCFLTGKRSDFQTKLFDHLQSKIQGDELGLNARNDLYFPVIPVTVEVFGDVPQPKVVGNSKAVAEGVGTKKIVKAGFNVTNDGGGISQKAIDVFFKASGNATYGQDWLFREKFVTRDWKSQKHGEIWVEKGKKGGADAIYGIRIGRDGDDMRSKVNFDVRILADNENEGNETIKFRIVDLDLYTRTVTRGWDRYAVSRDSDADGVANRAERLLLEKGAMTSKISIKDAPVSAARSDQLDFVEAYDWLF